MFCHIHPPLPLLHGFLLSRKGGPFCLLQAYGVGFLFVFFSVFSFLFDECQWPI